MGEGTIDLAPDEGAGTTMPGMGIAF
jgi:hypothetical protein